jgi:hypothetical protein
MHALQIKQPALHELVASVGGRSSSMAVPTCAGLASLAGWLNSAELAMGTVIQSSR